MLPSIAVLVALLQSSAPHVAQGEGVRLPDSTRRVPFALVLTGAPAESGSAVRRLVAVAATDASALGVRLVPFDLRSALELPDTLLVVAITVGPEPTVYSIDTRWLVPLSRFVAETKHTRFPLRLACIAGTSEGMVDVRADAGWVDWTALETRFRELVHQTLACFARET